MTDFRGLGQLDAKELASLFPNRKVVGLAELKLADSSWRAYCSPDPTQIEQILEADTSALPFLGAALGAHLKRFPSIKNGLGAIENVALGLTQDGPASFNDIFAGFADAEPNYGLGDSQLALVLARMISAKRPALRVIGVNGNDPAPPPTLSTLQNTKIEITELGRAMLKGGTDFVSQNGIDMWLGGVHLDNPEKLLRWDDQLEKLVSNARV